MFSVPCSILAASKWPPSIKLCAWSQRVWIWASWTSISVSTPWCFLRRNLTPDKSWPRSSRDISVSTSFIQTWKYKYPLQHPSTLRYHPFPHNNVGLPGSRTCPFPVQHWKEAGEWEWVVFKVYLKWSKWNAAIYTRFRIEAIFLANAPLCLPWLGWTAVVDEPAVVWNPYQRTC